MAEKRKQPGKNRGGRPRKKRIEDAVDATPSPKRHQRQEVSTTPSKKATATPAPSVPAELPVEETLPTKISDSRPLPTLPKPQAPSSLSECQSYAESGIVTAALHRSRTRWLHDCLFEKYWTKPSKRKNQPQPTFQNPPKDSMAKLGPCTMVIEPHYFDIMLYTAHNTPQKPPNPPPPGKPSTDPVIQLLANRAATNPDLRALMRIVADSQADQEQLRAFQAHIDEINAIIASRNPKDSQAKAEPPTQTVATPVSAEGGQNRIHTPIVSRSPAVNSGATHHPQNQPPHSTGSPYPPPQGTAPIRAKNTQKLPPAQNGCFRPQFPQPVAQPTRIDIKSVVFEFILPAGSNNGPTGDRYLFPENMILDYFPGNTTVIASFLAIKQIGSEGSSTDSDKKLPSGKGKGKKAKLAQASATPTLTEPSSQAPVLQPDTKDDVKDTDAPAGDDSKATDGPKSTDELPSPSGSKPKVKEYYQPVTLRLHANNPRTLEPLARVVKPPGEVRDYMNDVMDRIERADIEYLAFRLPREQRRGRGATAGDESSKTVGPIRGIPKAKGTESEAGVATPQNVDGPCTIRTVISPSFCILGAFCILGIMKGT
ncbi:conserved hypothetical protein [Microsporum canis CBS 113480]|uniref:SWR1-complex protein 3 domain-containing protein n=1 Tax=Arthroderma otae (strain ATCC MYA-4605 / CBS 113480) TaxID=554155 RepID=C5FSR2_ARTOC|nr:conserved hypothetical protein [Microsporum canis CBS 113480]EEQ32915.1 conserved hypothetical protein [Microsporum canis CBS 113480]